MKFSCEKYLLLQAVNMASRCVAAKSPMPILEGILVEAGQDIRLTGYDLKKGIYTNIPADVEDPGAVVLNAKLFGEIIRSLPEGIVTVDMDANYNTSIICEASGFSIMGSPSEEYPEFPTVNGENFISIPQNILSKMIRQTIFSVSDNEARPVYTGEYFDIQGDVLTIVAVDGYRLALRKEKVEVQDVEDCSFIVPATSLSDVEKLCADTDDKIEITIGAKHIMFVIDKTVFLSRRIEGEFLNYQNSIPTEFGSVVEMDREEFLKAVSRVSLIIDEITRNPLQVSVEKDKMLIRCKTSIGSAEDECAVKLTGNGSLFIGFNSHYLMDILKAAPGDKLHLGMNTSSSPCVITPADESDNFSYMLLPVRLRAD